MEKIKAALHIHDKTEVPGDGAVGNMQNPSSSDGGPTSEELWGSGNADTKHHHSHKSDTLAAAAAAPGPSKVGFCSPDNPRLYLPYASLTNDKYVIRTILNHPQQLIHAMIHLALLIKLNNKYLTTSDDYNLISDTMTTVTALLVRKRRRERNSGSRAFERPGVTARREDSQSYR